MQPCCRPLGSPRLAVAALAEDRGVELLLEVLLEVLGAARQQVVRAGLPVVSPTVRRVRSVVAWRGAPMRLDEARAELAPVRGAVDLVAPPAPVVAGLGAEALVESVARRVPPAEACLAIGRQRPCKTRSE